VKVIVVVITFVQSVISQKKEMSHLRKLTVNSVGKQITSICLHCKKNEVPIENWNKKCDECREKQAKKDAIEMAQIDMGIGKRLPAAVLDVDIKGKTQKVFVDKFGREVENPGYDLEGDPRGWGYTKTEPKKRDVIV
jgi:hypothetical protein